MRLKQIQLFLTCFCRDFACCLQLCFPGIYLLSVISTYIFRFSLPFFADKNMFVYALIFQELKNWGTLPQVIHAPDRCGILECRVNEMMSAHVCIELVTIKGHSEICSSVSRCNATALGRFECRLPHGIVHRSRCQRTECSCHYQKLLPTLLQRIWQYIQLPSRPQTTCNYTIAQMMQWAVWKIVGFYLHACLPHRGFNLSAGRHQNQLGRRCTPFHGWIPVHPVPGRGLLGHHGG